MMSLTTAQRDLLRQLLAADAPISAAALGQQLHLTPRQIQYSLREIKTWLSYHHATLRHTPGLGAQVVCTQAQKQCLLAELASQARFQLVLTSEQRQQLLALQLLTANSPLILSQFQDAFAVARATILKDLDATLLWLQRFQLMIGRRRHRGFWVAGLELARRQALAALLWGDQPFTQPLLGVEAGQRIRFALAPDAALLPAVAQANALLNEWDLPAAQQSVTEAEAELGGRFADEAVLYLALGITIQSQRVARGQLVAWEEADLRWLQTQTPWPVAARLATQRWPHLSAAEHSAETAALALLLIAHERDEPWRGDLAHQMPLRTLIEALLEQIAQAFALPELAHDHLLREGLETHLLPAYVRQRFRLWAPTHTIIDTQAERYGLEREIATELDAAITAAIGVSLPPDAHHNLILLLHAALVRARPKRIRHVLVVCPSGMATTQLLIARLKARFPHFGTFEVLPIRSLSAERIAKADLIIATVPLTLPTELEIDVIQVHPMLKPEDIAVLTQWIA
jgi:mannitol operon transcriptional antiterminator